MAALLPHPRAEADVLPLPRLAEVDAEAAEVVDTPHPEASVVRPEEDTLPLPEAASEDRPEAATLRLEDSEDPDLSEAEATPEPDLSEEDNPEDTLEPDPSEEESEVDMLDLEPDLLEEDRPEDTLDPRSDPLLDPLREDMPEVPEEPDPSEEAAATPEESKYIFPTTNTQSFCTKDMKDSQVFCADKYFILYAVVLLSCFQRECKNLNACCEFH